MSLLAYGAGAAEGLDTMLERMLREEAVGVSKGRLAEDTRHNQAQEGNTADQIRESAATRRMVADNTQSNQRRIDEDRDNTRTLHQLDLTPIGSAINPAERAAGVKAGAPESSFLFKPANMGMSTPEGEVGPSEDKVVWGGTSAQQQAAKDKQAAGMQRDTVLFKNKPTDVLTDVHSGKTFLPGQSGNEDITGQTSHYEKPSPSFSPVQSGSGYVRFNRKTGKYEDDDGKEITNPPLATTSSTRTMQEGASMLDSHVQGIKAQAENLEKSGQFGPVMSRIRHLAEKVGTIDAFYDAVTNDPELSKDRAIGKFATSLGLLATGAGRVHGGARGGGSPQMLEHFKALLNDSSSIQMFLGRIDAVDDYMKGYAAGPAGSKGNGSSPDDPLGLFKPKQ